MYTHGTIFKLTQTKRNMTAIQFDHFQQPFMPSITTNLKMLKILQQGEMGQQLDRTSNIFNVHPCTMFFI